MTVQIWYRLLSQQVGLKRNEIYFFKDALAPLIFDIVFYKNLPTFTLVFPNTVFVAVEEEEVPDVVDKDTFILFELSMLLLSFEFGKGLLVDVDDSAKSVVAVVVDVVVNIDIGCEVEGNWLMISLVTTVVMISRRRRWVLSCSPKRSWMALGWITIKSCLKYIASMWVSGTHMEGRF